MKVQTAVLLAVAALLASADPVQAQAPPPTEAQLRASEAHYNVGQTKYELVPATQSSIRVPEISGRRRRS